MKQRPQGPYDDLGRVLQEGWCVDSQRPRVAEAAGVDSHGSDMLVFRFLLGSIYEVISNGRTA